MGLAIIVARVGDRPTRCHRDILRSGRFLKTNLLPLTTALAALLTAALATAALTTEAAVTKIPDAEISSVGAPSWRRLCQRVLTVNGRASSSAAHATTLLDALHEHILLTGTKKGCDPGQRGASAAIIIAQSSVQSRTPASNARRVSPTPVSY